MIETEKEKVHSAIYAGSFDPPTRGHENIIVRASKMFDVLYVAMAHNPNKQTTKFWTETRYKMLESIIKANGLTNVRIITITSKELTVEKAHELGASVLIRGCRDGADFDYEAKLALSNRRLAPDVETLILPPEPEFYYTSSTSARQAIDLIFANKVKEGYTLLKDIVPECTYKYFAFYVGCPGRDVKMRDYVDSKQETTV